MNAGGFRQKALSIFLLPTAFLFLSGPPISWAAAENEKLAYVDIAKIFDSYQKTKDKDKVLQDAGKKKEDERQGLVESVRQMKDEMALLTDEAKAKKEEAMEVKVRELQDFDRSAKRELGEQRSKAVREIFKDIDDTVRTYGERKGLDLILNERALLYHHAKYDATQEVLNELNKNYSKLKK